MKNFDFRRHIVCSRMVAKGVTLISLLWIGLGFYLQTPICTAAAAIVTAGSIVGLILHTLQRDTLARCVWLGGSNLGVFLGANLVDRIGHMDFILVACVGVPFLIFSLKDEKGLMFALSSLPIVLWGIAWGADFNLFGYHEVGPDIAGQYIDVAAVLTVFVLVSMELGYFAVVTEKSEKELKNTLDLAERANSAKSEFLSSMSHELRTPLNGILGFAQLLGYDPLNPLTARQKDNTDQIIKSGHHLLELIDQVLELAQIEAGKLSISIEDVSLRELLDECVSLVKTMAGKKGIAINYDSVKYAGTMVRADRVRLKQIVLNLLSNAVKYNRDEGSIAINVVAGNTGMVHIAITDSGSGISVDKQGGLFEPFNRLGHESSEIEGTGIGLTISRNLAHLMDGEIDFTSEVGKGSTFWVEVPLSTVTAQRQEAEASIETAGLNLNAPIGDTAKRHTVLYVEDNPANLMLMEKILNNIPNLDLVSAHTAELGIEMAEAQVPDLVLMDINLPGMNGIDALKHLQNSTETKDIPVIAITASAMPKEVEAGMEAGFRGYITKPFNVPELIRAIEDILGSTKKSV